MKKLKLSLSSYPLMHSTELEISNRTEAYFEVKFTRELFTHAKKEDGRTDYLKVASRKIEEGGFRIWFGTWEFLKSRLGKFSLKGTLTTNLDADVADFIVADEVTVKPIKAEEFIVPDAFEVKMGSERCKFISDIIGISEKPPTRKVVNFHFEDMFDYSGHEEYHQYFTEISFTKAEWIAFVSMVDGTPEVQKDVIFSPFGHRIAKNPLINGEKWYDAFVSKGVQDGDDCVCVSTWVEDVQYFNWYVKAIDHENKLVWVGAKSEDPEIDSTRLLQMFIIDERKRYVFLKKDLIKHNISFEYGRKAHNCTPELLHELNLVADCNTIGEYEKFIFD